MKKYLKIFYDAGTIAFHYTILYSLYSGFAFIRDSDLRVSTLLSNYGMPRDFLGSPIPSSLGLFLDYSI